MLARKVLGTGISTAANGPNVEMNISPFFPRHKVEAVIELTDDFAGQMTIESSDTGLFAGEETIELDTGVIAATADKVTFTAEVVLKKYMRYDQVSNTAGTSSAFLRSGS